MQEEVFNLILKMATYDGDTSYGCYEDLICDDENAGRLALSPLDIKRIAYVAFELGKAEGMREVE